jgi:divinyl chlorophyllide a 8-vinyl-reductase
MPQADVLAAPAPGGAARRVLLLGATGTIGQATARALVQRGHEVVALVRPRAGVGGRLGPAEWQQRLPGVTLRLGQASDPASIARDGFGGEPFDVLVSCLASRTGAPADAWAIDHQAHLHALRAAQAAGVRQVVLLSALCVQKPCLAFQQAKLATEQALVDSGLAYSIVRPTAFFKSLCGQVERVRRGQPYLLFGDGRLTACKPISDDDLAAYLAGCLDHPQRLNKVLPIGGPGPAITPRDQGEHLFALLGRPARFRQVPVGLMTAIVGALAAAARLYPPLAGRAEFARIGHYYATESMLVWDAAAGRYDADATPSFGRQSLFDCYAALVRGEVAPERGDHAVF